MTTALTEGQLLADLRITFPNLWARPLSEFGLAYANAAGVWTGGRDGRMPDGDPIFFDLADGEPPYNGTIHEAFESWLDRRGWWVERYDGATYLLLPEASA